MASLQNLSVIASPSNVPVCERGGRLCVVPQIEFKQDSFLPEYYPEIYLNTEALNSSFHRPSDARRSVLIPVNEGVFKRITRTFFESGLFEALNEARDPSVAVSNPFIASVASHVFRALEFTERLKNAIFPQIKKHGHESIAKYSETRNWMTSPIRHIAWHPNTFKLAVATTDDSIRIYLDEAIAVPQLKNPQQRDVTSMAWRPFAPAVLAVGCNKGICIWHLDHNYHLTRPMSQAAFLKHPNHSPVTSVQWNNDGTLLATSSISSTNIIIWDVDTSQTCALKRVGQPCSFLKWSLNGSCLLSATVGNVFRVWSADKQWATERWTIRKGYVQSAAWSPCNTFLLFVTSEDSSLYLLQFSDEIFAAASQAKHALAIADLSRYTVNNHEIGGKPQSLAWDPSGMYLAISFKDTPCIAIFSTCITKHNMGISPSYFITGTPAEYPSFICFQTVNRKNSNIVLTIGWSSGRVQYFPFENM